MNTRRILGNERGIAMMVVLLVALAVGAIALGAGLMSMNTRAINTYSDRLGTLQTAADAGIELARSRINGKKSLYPDTLYSTLEAGASVKDASGNVIPGLQRWTYVGPTGISSGQYGVYGSIVSVVKDAVGDQIVRRGEVYQESFAKFAYFTDVEGSIVFANGDQIWGPVHSNDQINIYKTPTPAAWFHNTVETAQTISNKSNARFDQGYTEHGSYIAMPTTTDLAKLQAQATMGNTYIVGTTSAAAGQATTRVEFVAVDLNGDGKLDGPNEGFIRVYQAKNNGLAWWVVADNKGGNTYTYQSDNCADATGHSGLYVVATSAVHASGVPHTAQKGMTKPTARCFLGGSEQLNADNLFHATDANGQWLPWPGTVDPAVQAARPADAAYLWPINRQFNPSFKGVIFVSGDVAISGTVRGQVTLAASGKIVIADDVKYATDAGAGTCNDMLGIFAGADVVIADNLLNSPQVAYSGQGYTTYDDTQDEFIQGVVLTLNQFTAENYNSGSTTAEPCGGVAAGRGCLYLTGGIIQESRGPVGLTNGSGYIKRYAYDQCVLDHPPPYFPTTGHFARGRQFEVDPVGFNVASYYAALGPH
jgi:hypothetical protein